MSDLHVKLGKHDALPVYQQKWRRVVKRLGSILDTFRDVSTEDEMDGAALLNLLGDRTYYVLETFIPRLPEFMPEWEFNGYGSPEAFRNDAYDDEQDNSPTFPQLLDALDIIVEVNGGKRFLGMLGKVFDPNMIRAEASLALSEWRERRSTGSPSSPGTSGESDPKSSTTTPPTQEPSVMDEYVSGREWMPPRLSGEPLLTSG